MEIVSTEAGDVSKRTALVMLYQTINHPQKAGPKWVTYSREQTTAMLDVLKQIIEKEE